MSAAGVFACVVVVLGGDPVTPAQRATFGAGLAELRRLGYVARGGLTSAGRREYAKALDRLVSR